MTTQMIITLCILAFMVIMLLTHRLPYGLTAMICCALFVLTGVTDLSTAFSGFSGSTTIMVAGMIVVAVQLGKTSIVKRLRAFMERMKGSKGFVLIAAFFIVTILLSQLMGQIAALSIMLLFAQTLDDDSDITPARMLFAVCALNTIWTAKIPVAMGATMPGTINSFFEGVAPAYSIGIADYFKAAFIPGIVGVIYCLIAFRLIPTQKINNSELKEVKEEKIMSMKDEIIVFAVFAVIMCTFIFSKLFTKDVQNIIPIAGVLVLIVTGVVDTKEVIKHLTSDIVFMIAGMSAISTILGQTGVGELIGQTVLKILGGNPAPIFVVAVFAVVTAVITNLLSNMGTMALMIPIAASTALAGGFNVETVVLVTAVASWMAFVLPTGCAGSMIAFGTGNFNTAKTFKFTIPLFILELVSLIIGTTMFFPIYA